MSSAGFLVFMYIALALSAGFGFLARAFHLIFRNDGRSAVFDSYIGGVCVLLGVFGCLFLYSGM